MKKKVKFVPFHPAFSVTPFLPCLPPPSMRPFCSSEVKRSFFSSGTTSLTQEALLKPGLNPTPFLPYTLHQCHSGISLKSGGTFIAFQTPLRDAH